MRDVELAGCRDHRSLPGTRKSALIPLLHLAQEQDGYVTDEAMEPTSPSWSARRRLEVLSTCSFYEMFKRPGRHLPDQHLHGASAATWPGGRLIDHAEESLGVPAGGTTADGMITIEASSASRRAPRRRACRSTTATWARCGHERFRRTGRRAAQRRAKRRSPSTARGLTVRQHIPPEMGRGRRSPEQDGPPSWWARAPTGRRWWLAAGRRRDGHGRIRARRRLPSTTTGKIVTSRRDTADSPHPRRLPPPPAATRGCAERSADPGRGPRRGHGAPACSAAAAPASPPASSGASARRHVWPATWSSTATRASPAPTRTACSWSATRTS